MDLELSEDNDCEDSETTSTHDLEPKLEDTTIECDYKDCNQMFCDTSTMKKHQDKSHTINYYDLPECRSKNSKLNDINTVIQVQFQCNIKGCALTFLTEEALSKHKTIHCKFGCDWTECQQRFRKVSELTEHMNTHQKNRPFKCRFKGCQREFFDQKSIGCHLREVLKNNNTPIEEDNWESDEELIGKDIKPLINKKTNNSLNGKTCDFCDFKPKTEKQLKKHILRQHTPIKEGTVECNFVGCDRMFKTSDVMESHYRLTHNIKLISCDYPKCGEQFRSRTKYEKHKKIHSSLKIEVFDDISYNESHKPLISDRNLIIQKTIHSFNESMISCHFCEFKAKTEKKLKRHIFREHTPIKEETIECDFVGCTSMFNTHKAMVNHSRMDHNINLIPCDYPECGQQFRSKNQYNKHIYSARHHARVDQGPFQTTDTVSALPLLRVEMLTLNDMPQPVQHICDNESNKPLVSEQNLKIHKTIDSLNQKTCNFCGFEFKTEIKLRKHINSMHTSVKERTVDCDFVDCNKKFKNETGMVEHSRFAHNINLIRCDYPECDQQFRTEFKYKEHKKIHSAVKYGPIPINSVSKEKTETQKSFECIECKKLFTTECKLKAHEKYINSIERKKCHFCLKKPVRSEPTPLEERTVKCDFVECNKKFKNEKGMVEHSRFAHNINLIPCDYPECDQQFRRQQQFDKHKSIHSGIKYEAIPVNAVTQVKHKSVQNKSSILKKRTFVCPHPECGKGFTTQYGLDQHITDKH